MNVWLCHFSLELISSVKVWLLHLGLRRKTMMKSGEFLCRLHVNILYQLHIYKSISNVFYEFTDSVSWLPVLSSKVIKGCIWKSHWSWEGSCGAPGHKAFLCPLFFHSRKWTSFNLHDRPWVPMGRFKHLLIRKGMGYWDRGGRNHQETHQEMCSLGTRSWSHTHTPQGYT